MQWLKLLRALHSAGFHGNKLQLTFLFLITCLLRAFIRTFSMPGAWPWTVPCSDTALPFILLLSSDAPHTLLYLWNCCISRGITQAVVAEPLISLSLGVCWYHQGVCRGCLCYQNDTDPLHNLSSPAQPCQTSIDQFEQPCCSFPFIPSCTFCR